MRCVSRWAGAIDFKAVFLDEMSDDRVAVADLRIIVHDIRKLAARRVLGVKDMLMPERQFA